MSLTLTRNVGEAVILQAVDVTYRLTVLTCGAGRVRFSALNLVTDQQVIRAIERGGPKWNIFGDVWLDVSVTRGRQARLVFDAPREVVILREELEAFAPDIRELRQYVGRATREAKPPIFITSSGNAEALPPDSANRRFTVLHLSKRS